MIPVSVTVETDTPRKKFSQNIVLVLAKQDLQKKCSLKSVLMHVVCLSDQEMAQSRQRPLLKDSLRQNSILGEEQFH